MNLHRYVNMAFVGIGMLTWIVMSAAFGFLFEVVAMDWDVSLIGAKFTVSDLMALLAGAGAAIGLRTNQRVYEMALEIAGELKKVTWPTWKEVRVSTIVVIITSIVVAMILGLFDFIWAWATKDLYLSAGLDVWALLKLSLVAIPAFFVFYWASREQS